MRSTKKHDVLISEYWLVFYLREGLCSLCGNTGLIDTRATARSPSGFYCGDVNYCICPNGQTMRRSGLAASIALEQHKKNVNGRLK